MGLEAGGRGGAQCSALCGKGDVECAEPVLFPIKGRISFPFHLFTNSDKGDGGMQYKKEWERQGDGMEGSWEEEQRETGKSEVGFVKDLVAVLVSNLACDSRYHDRFLFFLLLHYNFPYHASRSVFAHSHPSVPATVSPSPLPFCSLTEVELYAGRRKQLKINGI